MKKILSIISIVFIILILSIDLYIFSYFLKNFIKLLSLYNSFLKNELYQLKVFLYIIRLAAIILIAKLLYNQIKTLTKEVKKHGTK